MTFIHNYLIKLEGSLKKPEKKFCFNPYFIRVTYLSEYLTEETLFLNRYLKDPKGSTSESFRLFFFLLRLFPFFIYKENKLYLTKLNMDFIRYSSVQSLTGSENEVDFASNVLESNPWNLNVKQRVAISHFISKSTSIPLAQLQQILANQALLLDLQRAPLSFWLNLGVGSFSFDSLLSRKPPFFSDSKAEPVLNTRENTENSKDYESDLLLYFSKNTPFLKDLLALSSLFVKYRKATPGTIKFHTFLKTSLLTKFRLRLPAFKELFTGRVWSDGAVKTVNFFLIKKVMLKFFEALKKEGKSLTPSIYFDTSPANFSFYTSPENLTSLEDSAKATEFSESSVDPQKHFFFGGRSGNALSEEEELTEEGESMLKRLRLSFSSDSLVSLKKRNLIFYNRFFWYQRVNSLTFLKNFFHLSAGISFYNTKKLVLKKFASLNRKILLIRKSIQRKRKTPKRETHLNSLIRNYIFNHWKEFQPESLLLDSFLFSDWVNAAFKEIPSFDSFVTRIGKSLNLRNPWLFFEKEFILKSVSRRTLVNFFLNSLSKKFSLCFLSKNFKHLSLVFLKKNRVSLPLIFFFVLRLKRKLTLRLDFLKKKKNHLKRLLVLSFSSRNLPSEAASTPRLSRRIVFLIEKLAKIGNSLVGKLKACLFLLKQKKSWFDKFNLKDIPLSALSKESLWSLIKQVLSPTDWVSFLKRKFSGLSKKAKDSLRKIFLKNLFFKLLKRRKHFISLFTLYSKTPKYQLFTRKQRKVGKGRRESAVKNSQAVLNRRKSGSTTDSQKLCKTYFLLDDYFSKCNSRPEYLKNIFMEGIYFLQLQNNLLTFLKGKGVLLTMLKEIFKSLFLFKNNPLMLQVFSSFLLSSFKKNSFKKAGPKYPILRLLLLLDNQYSKLKKKVFTLFFSTNLFLKKGYSFAKYAVILKFLSFFAREDVLKKKGVEEPLEQISLRNLPFKEVLDMYPYLPFYQTYLLKLYYSYINYRTLVLRAEPKRNNIFLASHPYTKPSLGYRTCSCGQFNGEGGRKKRTRFNRTGLFLKYSNFLQKKNKRSQWKFLFLNLHLNKLRVKKRTGKHVSALVRMTSMLRIFGVLMGLQKHLIGSKIVSNPRIPFGGTKPPKARTRKMNNRRWRRRYPKVPVYFG